MTPVQLRAILPQCRDAGAWSFELRVANEYGVNSPVRLAAFIAQVGHESGHLQYLTERLSYSVRGLRATWPRYFPDDTVAQRFARAPERLANYVYANRLGNGPFESGDGWRYRGRGLIQITGKANYKALEDATGKPYVQQPQMLERPPDAARSAAWYWQSHGLNELADAGDFAAITKRINGGLNGQAERLALWAKAKEVLGVHELA